MSDPSYLSLVERIDRGVQELIVQKFIKKELTSEEFKGALANVDMSVRILINLLIKLELGI